MLRDINETFKASQVGVQERAHIGQNGFRLG